MTKTPLFRSKTKIELESVVTKILFLLELVDVEVFFVVVVEEVLVVVVNVLVFRVLVWLDDVVFDVVFGADVLSFVDIMENADG